MSDIAFQPWPKIARLNRDIIISEKLDGTNAAVVITRTWEGIDGLPHWGQDERLYIVAEVGEFRVFAQSRNRFITPKQDNYGFAGWVQRNAEALVETLGEGTHFGEWWGSGIQRGYGRKNGAKIFSLFNAKRWKRLDIAGSPPGLDVVPVLYEGPYDGDEIYGAERRLRAHGSYAAPGFDRPEGIVVFHTASRESYKVTLEGDEAPKGAAGHALDNEAVPA